MSVNVRGGQFSSVSSEVKTIPISCIYYSGHLFSRTLRRMDTMLQEKDMNVLTPDMQQDRQMAEGGGVGVARGEDQEEFDKLKEVIPTLYHSNASQVMNV